MLEKINYPQDIKKLNIEELKVLASEIREFIIKNVSTGGGHLASSLGAVEICLALHYCLDTPRDTIIFDVGHQTYAHKIITGRKDKFSGLRKYKGLSGFPNPAESEYDVYISGHASTAVSWAEGIAEAKRLKQETSSTVAVIGDGSLTGGMCFEAFNHSGHRQDNILVVLNHNEMSISPSVGALSNYLTKIISMPIYNRIKNELDSFLKRLPSFAKKIASVKKRFEEALKSMIVPGVFFEELGFRYFGPIDGNDLGVLVPTIYNLLSVKGPKVLHVLTKKGRGYKYAEDNPEDFHSAASFSVSTGDFAKKKVLSFTEVFARKLTSLAEKDTRIVAITAAMSKGTGLNIFRGAFPERFLDVGIAEGHAVGLASGLAKESLRPFVAVYSTFLQRSLDQIIHDVALQEVPVAFCIDRAGFVGADGPTHHGVFDISYMRIVPGMVCMAPKDKEELEDMLEFSLSLNSPVSIRYPRDEAFSLNKREKITLGKSQIMRKGEDICVIALGSMVKEAMAAADIMEDKGVGVFLVNARFAKPLDKELLLFAGDNFKTVITIEEGVLTGGFGSGVMEFYEEKGYIGKVFLKRFGIPDEFSTFASRRKLLELYGLTAQQLAHSIEKLFKEEVSWQR
ncbi:MAG: 1-deoxy-D-xylulose-5-phosphate synthase [Candidatus Omnitrophica bacterium 4484_171]|nr:MAG: 1-deoxy-D-xylulose-5-phosphate synthase [Candidatus Omnitrophica bacterium 4484_171]